MVFLEKRGWEPLGLGGCQQVLDLRSAPLAGTAIKDNDRLRLGEQGQEEAFFKGVGDPFADIVTHPPIHEDEKTTTLLPQSGAELPAVVTGVGDGQPGELKGLWG